MDKGVFGPQLLDRVHAEDTTLRWPGLEQPQAAIVLQPPSDAQAGFEQLEVRTYGADSESAQRAEAGDHCD